MINVCILVTKVIMKKYKQAIKREYHQLKGDIFNLMDLDLGHQANLWVVKMIFP